ncbi:hypothetical protein [Nitrosomonas sp. Nm34]|uniref:hypothetical protein n=1 Tax=Nitrosomonas sp. Nm34 TaxID=1881055 RepID=UPI001C31D650|nr:hypothetical protein [Nitrosomonas sp. Nm34]
MKSITISFPIDVVESMKKVARLKGLSEYKILLKSYISAGLCRDEYRYSGISTVLLIEALKKIWGTRHRHPTSHTGCD